MKREYRVCPRSCKCVWAECLRRHMLLYALCVPLHGDFGRCEGRASPVESENGVESCTDGFESG